MSFRLLLFGQQFPIWENVLCPYFHAVRYSVNSRSVIADHSLFSLTGGLLVWAFFPPLYCTSFSVYLSIVPASRFSLFLHLASRASPHRTLSHLAHFRYAAQMRTFWFIPTKSTEFGISIDIDVIVTLFIPFDRNIWFRKHPNANNSQCYTSQLFSMENSMLTLQCLYSEDVFIYGFSQHLSSRFATLHLHIHKMRSIFASILCYFIHCCQCIRYNDSLCFSSRESLHL